MKEEELNEVLAHFIYGAGIAITVIFGLRRTLNVAGFLMGFIVIAIGSLLLHRSKKKKFWFFR